MKQNAFIFIGILLLIAFAYGGYYFFNPLTPKLQINNQVFTYEIAITDAQRQQGLSGRDPLPENHGMLFVFPNKAQHGFWMKDMKFALDFIWIDDTTVVDISENVPPPTPGQQPVALGPQKSVNRVLEVNAGTVQRTGIKVGDTVTYLRR